MAQGATYTDLLQSMRQSAANSYGTGVGGAPNMSADYAGIFVQLWVGMARGAVGFIADSWTISLVGDGDAVAAAGAENLVVSDARVKSLWDDAAVLAEMLDPFSRDDVVTAAAKAVGDSAGDALKALKKAAEAAGVLILDTVEKILIGVGIALAAYLLLSKGRVSI